MEYTPSGNPASSAREKEIEARQFWRRYLALKNAPRLLFCTNAVGTRTLCADAPGEVTLVSALMYCGAY